MGQTLTLTGYLGQDPQIKTTQSRIVTTTLKSTDRFRIQRAGKEFSDVDDFVFEERELEYTTTPRTYVVLSLATHKWQGSQRETSWHRIVGWNADSQFFGIRRLAKGDKIEITGRKTSYVTDDGRTIEQLELLSFRLISRNPRPRIQPELGPPAGYNWQAPAPSPRVFITADGRPIPLSGPTRTAGTACSARS